MRNLGIISYNYPHLKTEQVLLPLIYRGQFNITLFLLPFKPRKPREVLFQHRPDQSQGAHPKDIAARFDLTTLECQADTDISDDCDIYLILGAGLLSSECVKTKKILNIHPGVIPAAKGLDAFKWSVLENKPLGVTLHYIDEQVDAGEIITILPTPIFPNDTLETLSARHYQLEISLCIEFDYYLKHPQNPFKDIPEGEPRMRMPLDKEQQFIQRF